MEKKNIFYFTAVFIFLTGICSAQTLPSKDGKVFYEFTDSTSALSKTEIYQNTKAWVVHAFTDAKEVFQLDDKENGEVIGKGNFPFSYTMMLQKIPARCYFTFKVSCRDKKYRVQLYDFFFYQASDATPYSLESLNEKPDGLFQKKIIAEVDKGTTALLAKAKTEIGKPKDKF